MRSAILKLTVPATIIRSAWRGVARKAPAPKRSMSWWASADGHHLDRAAGQAEGHRPDAGQAGPVEQPVDLGGQDVLFEAFSRLAHGGRRSLRGSGDRGQLGCGLFVGSEVGGLGPWRLRPAASRWASISATLTDPRLSLARPVRNVARPGST